MEDIDHEGTDEIVCPYCGCEFGDSWKYLRDGTESMDIECIECGKDFSCAPNFNTTWYTRKKKETP